MRTLPFPRYQFIQLIAAMWICSSASAFPGYETPDNDRYVLSGRVTDAASGEPLAAANIRLLGTSRGTITNTQGHFTLMLDPGPARLLVSSLAYRPDTVEIRMTSDVEKAIALTPSDITLPEVVVTSEDPAIEIIRRAIASKRRWIDRLTSYAMDAFTRQVLKRDTSIAMITESYTRGYWQQGDTLREVVKQKRQTANIAAAQNFASVGRILNFNEDEVRFLGYTFIGPTALNALDYYDYKLLRTHSSQGKDVYEIRMIPKTRTVPLFAGTVSIANDSYALVGIDVQPNEAFTIPFVSEKYLRYRQQFGLYEGDFWMPADIRIDAAFSINLLGMKFPRFVLAQTSVITNYGVNTLIPDSIFHKPRLTVDSAATKIDSVFWASNPVLPLNVQEQHAYESIDSTQKLEAQFRPSGVTVALAGDSGLVGSLLNYADLSFNRVEGLHAGVRVALDNISSILSAHFGLAYGFSDRRAKYVAGGTLFASARRRIGIGAEVYRLVANREDQGYYGSIANSLSALLDKNDYRDYYRTDGWRAFITATPLSDFKAELSFINELQQTAPQETDFSIIFPSRHYRANPEIEEGMLRSLRLDIHVGPDPIPLDLVARDGMDVSIERSSPSLARSHFDFTRYSAVGSLALVTFGSSYLFKPQLRLHVAAGTSSGELPQQRLFDVETRSSDYAPFGVMHAMGVKEFTGTSYVALNVEQNFRTIPFLALGIPFLYNNNLELLIHGGAARTWNSGILPLRTTGDWYYEAGFGIGRIFDLMRADFTWRLTDPKGFAVTLGVATVL